MWHASSRSGVATLRTAVQLLHADGSSRLASYDFLIVFYSDLGAD